MTMQMGFKQDTFTELDEAKRKQFMKTMTPAQKARFEELRRVGLTPLKKLAQFLVRKAPDSVREQVQATVKATKDANVLRFLMIDLEYGIVGSMPPKPLKVNTAKLYGKSIKFGSIDGPAREGIVIGTVPTKTRGGPVQTALSVFLPGEKAPATVSAEQVIAIGTPNVSQATISKEVPPHPFNAPDKNMRSSA